MACKTLFHINTRIKPYVFSSISLFVFFKLMFINTDMTELREANTSLHSKNTELEEKIKQLQQENQAIKNRLKAIHDLSHPDYTPKHDLPSSCASQNNSQNSGLKSKSATSLFPMNASRFSMSSFQLPQITDEDMSSVMSTYPPMARLACVHGLVGPCPYGCSPKAMKG